MKLITALYLQCIIPILVVGLIVLFLQLTGFTIGEAGQYILFVSCVAGIGFLIMLVLAIIIHVFEMYEQKELD